ncbi:peptide deformylase [Leptothoe spongobia]|uniref:Peptide deformylase n=1 Tax=Leptothoe spongobia TAU-MAC 1115 TaxID=1967444 RepID=A0A947DH63_9CYAN|nr:peptide deformylase [Leptothoe spongobia]MBT9317032.1 peptide deformylase [Leptothoe spongobia TAU-MAC 1115]
MGQIRSVIELGDDRLRSQANPIQLIDDPQLQQLIDDLLRTTAAKNGVGIAAPQVAEGLQLFIVASHPNPRYPQAPVMEPTAMINPHLLSHSEDLVYGWEGCLSVPGQRGFVPRYREIEVTYLDRHGQEHHQYLQDFVARIFQHEYDHLQGIVFLDRIQDSQDILTETDYQRRFG